jgi:hypothetical protein
MSVGVVMQHQLFDDAPAVQGSVREKIRYVLQDYPETRDDYRWLMFRYWMLFEGLGAVLESSDPEAFRRWLVERATTPKTLQNRAMELQREYPELDARPKVRKRRDELASAGPVGRR